MSRYNFITFKYMLQIAHKTTQFYRYQNIQTSLPKQRPNFIIVIKVFDYLEVAQDSPCQDQLCIE